MGGHVFHHVADWSYHYIRASSTLFRLKILILADFASSGNWHPLDAYDKKRPTHLFIHENSSSNGKIRYTLIQQDNFEHSLRDESHKNVLYKP